MAAWTLAANLLFVLLRLFVTTAESKNATTTPTLRSLVVAHDVPAGFSIDRWASSSPESEYKLLRSPFSDRFALVDNGLLMTTAKLDALIHHPQPLTLYLAEDGPSRKSTHAVQVYVVDRHHLIRFSKPVYRAHVIENAPAGTLVVFVDGLSVIAENGSQVKFDIMSGGSDGFRIEKIVDNCTTSTMNQTLARLVTRRPLDRELQPVYDLVVRAVSAHPPGTATCRVIISVDDVNDNRPIFSAPEYHFEVPTTAMKYDRIGRVKAVDADGDHAIFRLTSPSNSFVMIPQTGEIILIDPQLPSSNRSYVLQVTAKDRREPGWETEQPAHIFIRTADEKQPEEEEQEHHNLVKRRAPRALRPTKRIEFSEADGAPEGKLMFALDKPSEKERFKVRDDNPWVTVEPNGNVRVKRKWDYEELGPEKTIDFWVTITNSEGGAGRYTDNQRVIVQVKDVNDEPPYFINRPLPMQAVVQLNAPPNTPVFTLQARDPDTDHNIHYFLVRDRTGGRFEVDERSGVVRTRGGEPFQLDMEYVLYVKAEDQNGRLDERRYQSTPEERLSIVGGKRPPQFYMPSYEAEIPENQKKDTDIISVRAKSFAEREIRYTLKATGQGAGTFNIGPTTGNVRLAKDLDFEDLRQPHVYQLQVTATEDSGGFSTSVELTIRVTDVNDNVPKFELPDYQAHNIDEDIPVGTSILKVKATDSDSGSNAEIEYSVSDDHFAIDSNGVISNGKQLDADNNNAYYEFTVTARDKGESPKSGTATVRIYTKNKNDEEPKFSQGVYTPNVDENAGPNTLVTTVVASDKDGDNVRFGFVGGGTRSGQFVIEELTGVIRLHSGGINLDRDKYELNVTAIDDGACCGGTGLTHTSTAVVVVFITDVNDNKPVFSECSSYSPKIEEGAPNGSPVVRVQATDADKGVNGQVKYSIVQQPNQKGTKFTVDEETGEIFTNKVFDREGDDGKFVSVTVKATDQGDPSLEGVCSFTVEITDVNDNPPLFDRQKYVENVKQDTNIGTNILRVSASDEDADNNGAIVYNLTAYNSQDLEYFTILPESGWIVLIKPLDVSVNQLFLNGFVFSKKERIRM